MELEREILGGPAFKKSALCQAGNAKLWADYIDEVIGELIRAMKALVQEVKETHAKVVILVTACKLSAFEKDMTTKLKGLEEQVTGYLDEVERDVRGMLSTGSSYGSTVSYAGREMAYEMSGPPYYYLEAMEQARIRGYQLSEEEAFDPRRD